MVRQQILFKTTHMCQQQQHQQQHPQHPQKNQPVTKVMHQRLFQVSDSSSLNVFLYVAVAVLRFNPPLATPPPPSSTPFYINPFHCPNGTRANRKATLIVSLPSKTVTISNYTIVQLFKAVLNSRINSITLLHLIKSSKRVQ